MSEREKSAAHREGQSNESPLRGDGGGKGSLNGAPRNTVLICGAEDFCEEAQRELQRRQGSLRVTSTQKLAHARELINEELPAAILAEERALAGDAAVSQRRQTLCAALSMLAEYAPVVWIGSAEDGGEVCGALRGVRADFVPRSALCLPAAITMLERRLRSGLAYPERGSGKERFSFAESALEGRDFGQVLRHELNNPLTGILGNAELLLLEVRRGKVEMPPHALQRLEVIAELAVRMRETVRQLSDRWEAAGGDFSTEERSGEQPHSSAGFWKASPKA